MKRIPVRKYGRVVGYALVDDSDYAAVAASRWCLSTAGYPTATIGGNTVSMHRLILGLAAGDPRSTDHVNRRKLDNRRPNLRIATCAENNQNRERRDGVSRFRGVSPRGSRWRAVAHLAGRQFHLGIFDTELQAARAAAAWRAEHMPFSEDAFERAVA